MPQIPYTLDNVNCYSEIRTPAIEPTSEFPAFISEIMGAHFPFVFYGNNVTLSASWDPAQLSCPCSGLTSSLKAFRIPSGQSQICHFIVVITHLKSPNYSRMTALLFQISFSTLSPIGTPGLRVQALWLTNYILFNKIV